jgi:hypothetical protein
MGSNSPTSLTTIPVKTPGEAIAFLQHIRGGCRQRNFEWWINEVLNVYASDEACAAAATHLAKAIRIDDLMEQNLTTMLQQAQVQGVRLNMDDAANETPAPAAEGTARPTAMPSTPATNFRSALLQVGTHSLKAIETWALEAAKAAIGEAWPLLDAASQHDRPGTESIRTIQRIYAPITAQAASAARTALDNVFRDFTAEDAASTLVTKGLGAARICLYYKPLFDWNTHVVEEAVHRINALYGPQHLLTLSVTRCVDAEGFSTNPIRVELFQSTLVTYENTYGCGISGSSGGRASPLYVRAAAVATKGAEAAATAHPADAAADAAETATAPAVEAHAPETGFARGARPTLVRSSITMLLIAATNRSRNCWPICVPRASSRTGVHRLPRPKVTQSACFPRTLRETGFPAGTGWWYMKRVRDASRLSALPL